MKQLCPKAQEICTRADAILTQEWAGSGYTWRITSGLRTFAEQAATYAEGRTTPGEPCVHNGSRRAVGTCMQHPLGAVVTHAPPGHSMHNYGLAWDAIVMLNGAVSWNVQDAKFQRLVEVMRNLGAECGIDWSPGKVDPDHFEVRGVLPEDPTPEMIALAQGPDGLEAVWKAAFDVG